MGSAALGLTVSVQPLSSGAGSCCTPLPPWVGRGQPPSVRAWRAGWPLLGPHCEATNARFSWEEPLGSLGLPMASVHAPSLQRVTRSCEELREDALPPRAAVGGGVMERRPDGGDAWPTTQGSATGFRATQPGAPRALQSGHPCLLHAHQERPGRWKTPSLPARADSDGPAKRRPVLRRADADADPPSPAAGHSHRHRRPGQAPPSARNGRSSSAGTRRRRRAWTQGA